MRQTEISRNSISHDLLLRYWFFWGHKFCLNLIQFQMVHFRNFCNQTAMIRKYSEEEILWWLFIFNLKCLCHQTNWKELLNKYRLKIRGLLKFGNLSWKWFTLVVFTISVILPPRKNTWNGFGVSSCYQKMHKIIRNP